MTTSTKLALAINKQGLGLTVLLSSKILDIYIFNPTKFWVYTIYILNPIYYIETQSKKFEHIFYI